MTKVTLTGRKQTTTRTIGADIAKLIGLAKIGVMVRYAGRLIGMMEIQGTAAILDGGEIVALSALRIYRSTIAQLRELTTA